MHGYVKKSDVIDICMEWCPDDDGTVAKTGDMREMLDEIECLDSEDVEKVVHAYWIHHKSFLWGHIVTCSRCGNSLSMNGVNGGRGDANYCPNCGAKMDEIFIDMSQREN